MSDCEGGAVGKGNSMAAMKSIGAKWNTMMDCGRTDEEE